MDKTKFLKIKNLLKKDGFIIDGIVGSYARGEEYNDIDIFTYTHLTICEFNLLVPTVPGGNAYESPKHQNIES